MSLKAQWKRFERECLAGLSRDEIDGARDVFYIGASAATDIFMAVLRSRSNTRIDAIKTVTALIQELESFKVETAMRAKQEDAGKAH